MIQRLRSNLPTGFRITSYPKFEAKALLSLVESTFFKELVSANSYDATDSFNVPYCLPWSENIILLFNNVSANTYYNIILYRRYPNRLGWQIQITRNDIRKSEAYFRLHNFLISETQSGNISRQEVVSMIPPILLDVRSHHKVSLVQMFVESGAMLRLIKRRIIRRPQGDPRRMSHVGEEALIGNINLIFMSCASNVTLSIES